MPKALLIEMHSWRGLSFGRDLFLSVAVLGFVTVAVSRDRLSDKLRALLRDLSIFKGRDRV